MPCEIEKIHHRCQCGNLDVIQLPNLISKQNVKAAIDHELERLRKQCGILQYDALVNVKNKLGLK